jgi:hypothetical protein
MGFMSDAISMLEKALAKAKEEAKGSVQGGSLHELVKKHTFDINRRPEKDTKVCWINGELVGSKGNVISFTGGAKSRKTVLATSLTASAICGREILGVQCLLNENEKVLHIDTEQGYEDYYETVMRILRVAGKTEVPENFVSVHERAFDVVQRFDALEYLFKLHKPTMCIIDGIRDLLMDFNSNEETSKVISNVMRLSFEYNALIVCVIHVTKSHGNMRGALGTALEDKSETVIKVEKDEKDKNKSAVYPLYSRHKDFERFEIEWSDEANGYVKVDLNANEGGRPKKGEMPIEMHREKVYNIFAGRKLGYKAMIDGLKACYECGDNKAKELAKMLIEHGVIYNDSYERTYQYSSPV